MRLHRIGDITQSILGPHFLDQSIRFQSQRSIFLRNRGNANKPRGGFDSRNPLSFSQATGHASRVTLPTFLSLVFLKDLRGKFLKTSQIFNLVLADDHAVGHGNRHMILDPKGFFTAGAQGNLMETVKLGGPQDF